MIGLDTNVLVRYLTQDDSKQSFKAAKLIESFSDENPGFISLVSIVELVWVLQGCYGAAKDDTITVLDTLLRVKTLHIQNAEVLIKAVRTYARSTADFADCLIERFGYCAGCLQTVTFDIQAVKTAGMQLIQ
jgi:predicted nucleic-acid-binding protein